MKGILDREKVLVTGGSHAEIPLIKALHDMGYYVITTGNNTDGLGHVEADEYIQGDFSDKEFVLSIAAENKVVGIVSGCNDFAYLSTAYACEHMGFKGHDTYRNSELIHHKDNFREILNRLLIKTPSIVVSGSKREILEQSESFNYPCMVKAVDLTGGKGVRKCNRIEEIEKAVDEAFSRTRQDSVIIEEFIEGENHGYSCLVKDNKVVFGFLDDEQYFRSPYLVSGACGPSERSDIIDQLNHDISLVFSELHLEDGLFHVQIIIDKDNYPVMIDPCRRSPGDLYVNLVKYSTGIDYPAEIVRAELGKGVSDKFQNGAHTYVARECIMSENEGVFKKVNISNDIKDYIIDSMIWSRPGDDFVDSFSSKAGIVFMKFKSREEMKDKVESFHKQVQIEFE